MLKRVRIFKSLVIEYAVVLNSAQTGAGFRCAVLKAVCKMGGLSSLAS